MPAFPIKFKLNYSKLALVNKLFTRQVSLTAFVML